jgi:predicted MPP superfamily phosphohydrolase
MVAVDLAILGLLWWRPRLLDGVGLLGVAGVVGLMAALWLREGAFGALRLMAWGIFLHGPILLVGAAVCLRRRSRLFSALSALGAVGLLAVAVDAFLIEPTWLEVSHVRIASPKIERPVKIVVLADLQTDRIGDYEREVLRRAMRERPDVILWAGDYLQLPRQRYEAVRKELNDYMREIDFGAGAKVFAVRGNLERNDWAEIFDGLDVTTVQQTESFDLESFRLTGLSLGMSYQASRELRNDAPDRFHLVVGHLPNFALWEVMEADLLVAGHTHGGQVRLPLIGPLTVNCRIPLRWGAGLTELSHGRRLLVSRGIGLERNHSPRMRFLCRPELVVIELVPEDRP